jgi:uncharacterized protein (TIGR02118 family)
MTEFLLIALWKAPTADLMALLANWATPACARSEVHSLTANIAAEDQPYTNDPVDLVFTLGLELAHDLDDVPDRDELYKHAREVKVWRVDPRRPITWDRTWPDGEMAPGVKMVSFVKRAEGLTHEQFVRHWTENHAPLAREHHAGLWNYTQNVVRRTYTPGGAGIDGIAELHFRTRESYETEFYDSDQGREVIRADVKRFINRSGEGTALMRELPLKTPPTGA